jgi:putative inorganic carbon (HCO3(-)) transporter
MNRIVLHGRRWAREAAIWLKPDTAAFLLLAVAAPCLLFPGGWRTLALLILPSIWIVNWRASGHFVRRTPFDAIILALLVMVLVSLFATYSIPFSLPKITGVLLGVGVMYALAGFAVTPRRLAWAVVGWLTITAAFLAFALVGTDWSVKIPALQRVTAILPAQLRGLPSAVEGFHPAEVAGALTWIIFLPASVAVGLWLHTRPSRHKWLVALLLALTVLIGGVLLLTTSRSAWIGAAVGTSVLVLLAGRWGKVVVSAGVVIAVAVILIVGPDRFAHEIVSSPQPELGGVFTPNLESRVEIWSRALYGIQDLPFTGMGMGTFRTIVHVLYPLFLTSPDVDLGHAHNEFLQAALDLGLPGLIAFLALQGLALMLAYKTFRSGAPAWMRWTAMGALAGLVAHDVYGLTDAVALGAKPGILFWMLLGLIAGLFEQTQSDQVHHLPTSSVIANPR